MGREDECPLVPGLRHHYHKATGQPLVTSGCRSKCRLQQRTTLKQPALRMITSGSFGEQADGAGNGGKGSTGLTLDILHQKVLVGPLMGVPNVWCQI